MSAYLSARDADLLPWVDELARDGLLAEAVKAGLRIARALWGCPGGPEYLRRGVLSDAFLAGLLSPDSISHRRPDSPITPLMYPDTEVRSEPYSRLDEYLDRALRGV